MTEDSLNANRNIAVLVTQKDCVRAVMAFEVLDSAGRVLPQTRLRIADCYYELKDTASMKIQLKRLSRLKYPEIQSALLNQEALLKAFEGDTLEAINLYRKSIETKNDNNFAKHNYEYLNKVYHPNRNQNSQPETPQTRKNSNEGGLVEQSNRRDDVLNEPAKQEINLSQAMQILDAMRSNEANKILIVPANSSDSTFYGNQ